MKDKNTVENLKFISKTHRQLHAKRQQYEWRVIFTVLSFYVLSVAVLISNDTTAPNFQWFDFSVWFVFFVLACVSSGFLFYVHKANAKNKSYAEEAEKKLIDCINSCDEVELEFSTSEIRFAKWAFIWQSTMLIVVALASALFITAN